jgi:REP element-mobilizing transposase RayT
MEKRRRNRRREIVPGALYHLMSRFTGSEFFIETERERAQYRTLLGSYVAESDWKCFAYAIMSNHIHLGVRAGEKSLASWIQPVHSQFAQLINARTDRHGQVICPGPKSVRYKESEIARLIGYIHRNPVRAGVVRDPRDSDWTSHRAYCGLARPPKWLEVRFGLERAGLTASEFERLASTTTWDQREPKKRLGRPKKRRAG